MRLFLFRAKAVKDEKGYTLVAAVVVVTIIFIMVTTVTTIALSHLRYTKLFRDKTTALYLADSGIQDMVYHIIEEGSYFEDRDFRTDSPHIISDGFYDFGPGKKFEVWVRKDLSTGKLIITSKGTANKVFRIVEQNLFLPSIYPDPPGDNQIIETAPTSENENRDYYMEDYIYPEIHITMPPDPDEGSLDIGANTTISGDHYYRNINVQNGVTLTFTGPANIYIAESFKINNNSSVIINGNVNFYIGHDLNFRVNTVLDNQAGSVDFYIGQNAYFLQRGMFGDPADSTKLGVALSTDAGYLTYSVNVENNAQFYGGICAPNAQVNINNNAIIDGSVVGREVEVRINGVVTYDPQMATVTLTGEGTWEYLDWLER